FLEWKAGKAVREEVDKLKLSASNQVVAVYSSATNQIAAKFQLFAQDASNQISSAYSAVTNQIAAEFQTPRIQQTVESVARGEAKSILEAEVRPAVDSFRTDAQFQRLATRARAYDFKAYQALLELEKQTNDLAGDAQRVVTEIDRTLERDRSGSAFRRFAIVSGTNVYGGPFTPDELASLFWATQQDKSSPNREGFVNAIHELKQPMFLNGLMQFLTNETDLTVADRLTLAISDLAKQDFHPHDIERIIRWWQSHENRFTNWPLSELSQGFEHFETLRYPEAANSFEQVLKLDGAADMSRAFTIVCYWELGKTNEAATLAREFKDSASRWSQWATAKSELESGSISNATLRLAGIRTNFPIMSPFLKEGSPVWRKVDWPLFNKLTVTTKP
ncbi:MAG: hypothetical protein DME23_15835, partial [Verrucomicrobia bacterium]